MNDCPKTLSAKKRITSGDVSMNAPGVVASCGLILNSEALRGLGR